jgi:hypothetical protein
MYGNITRPPLICIILCFYTSVKNKLNLEKIIKRKLWVLLHRGEGMEGQVEGGYFEGIRIFAEKLQSRRPCVGSPVP